MSNEYVCSLIDKVWLTTDDIRTLCSCSRNSAMTIRREIEEKVKAAISDIVPYTESSVIVSRVEGKDSYKNTTLCISIEVNNINQILYI